MKQLLCHDFRLNSASVIQTQTFTKELCKEVRCTDSQNVNISAVLSKFISVVSAN